MGRNETEREKPIMTLSRITFATIFLFAIVLLTAYLQTVYSFSTDVALAICLLDTVVAAIILVTGYR